jgi:UPF0755 protein
VYQSRSRYRDEAYDGGVYDETYDEPYGETYEGDEAYADGAEFDHETYEDEDYDEEYGDEFDDEFEDEFEDEADDEFDEHEAHDAGDEFGELLGNRTAASVRRGAGGARTARRQAARRRRTALPKLIVVLLVTAALIGGGIYGVGKVVGRIGGGESTADFPGPGEGSAVVQVAPGATSRDIARALAAAGVVASAGAFVKVAAADSRSLSIQPGHYRLKQKMSATGALEALLDPAANSLYRFTIIEGMNVKQVIAELSKKTGVPVKEYQKVIDKPAQLGLPTYASTVEGYLFPTTYDLVPGASPADTLKMFVARFNDEVADLDLEHAAPAVGLKPQDVVTVASIIEKEVANKDECPKVSRVVYNRLNDRTGHFTRLDMDSTTRYASGNFDAPLTMSQLEAKSPYNTRAVAGLPPGAISNPGKLALQSALHPAQGSWLYFVSLPRSGVTIFATTDAEWADAQARYRSEGGGN